jgi:hypothetical protein
VSLASFGDDTEFDFGLLGSRNLQLATSGKGREVWHSQKVHHRSRLGALSSLLSMTHCAGLSFSRLETAKVKDPVLAKSKPLENTIGALKPSDSMACMARGF